MCNLYNLDTDIFGWAEQHQDFLSRRLVLPAGAAEGMANIDLTWKPQLYPNYRAPLVVRGDDGEDHVHFARWGMPSSKQALYQAASKRADKLRAKGKAVTDEDFKHLLRMEPDGGTTNIRNTTNAQGKVNRHWEPFLGAGNRCLVPMRTFSEPDQVGGSKRPIWFGMADDRPLAYFAGVFVNGWTSVRKVSEGEITCDLYGFLTCDAHPLVAQYHTKATPVILTTAEECEAWLTAPWDKAKALQKTPPLDVLKTVEPPVRAEA